jgi:O-antigen/teichoic acid export membrane protein
LFLQGSKALAVVGFGAFAFLAAFADPALLAWTGEAVPAAALALQIIVTGEVAMLMTGVVSANLRAQGRVGMEFTCAIVATTTVVIAVIPLATWIDFEGVVIARLVGQVVGAIWYLRAYMRFAGLPLLEYLRGAAVGRVLVVVAASTAAVWAADTFVPLPGVASISVRWGAAVRVVVWSLPYAGLLLVAVWTWVLDEPDRQRVRDVLVRFRRRRPATADPVETQPPPT